MGLVQDAILQAQIWRAYLRLNAVDDAERARAMLILREGGKTSLPSLRLGLRRADTPRVQFGAAVVLHWLGQPEGMETLIEALRWRLNANPALAPELEAAFIRIGSPDAVRALLDLWQQLTEWGEHEKAMESICHVWAVLRDPLALDGLVPRAPRIPTLFLKTIPAFGELAILPLERMLRDQEVARRLLGVRALRQVASGRAFDSLAALLHDPDPLVREEIPAALEACRGPNAAAEAISEAIYAGYSSRAAVESLIRICPPGLYETLLTLVARWNPQSATAAGDTGEALLAALPVLSHAPLPNNRIVPPLCDLLERRPGPRVIAAVARVFGARGLSLSLGDDLARSTLWPLLSHADSEARREAAGALERLGEPLGIHMERLIETCRPQEGILDKLQTLLRGGQDPGQFATQAMQQVSQWFTRLSKETARRLAPGSGGPELSAGALHDRRLPDLLRSLLGNALDALNRVTTPDEVEAMLSLCVAAVRALTRVDAPAALAARAELLRALHVVKYSMVYVSSPTATFRRSERREVAEIVRLTAAETIAQLYGESSFPLFLEALYAPSPEARGTAIVALGNLGDVRALPHLQAIVSETAHPLRLAAQEAVSLICRAHPEIMTLLRASMGDSRPDTLLRPASAVPSTVAPELLLRPSAPNSSQPEAG